MVTAPIRVLIVDDEERFRETTAGILRRRGFETTAVGSGTEAIDEVKRAAIDVVVLDIKMPGMDGITALREIRKIKPDLAVIMLTGHGTPESALERLRDGVFDYLTKPCAIDLLARKIREASVGTPEQRTGLGQRESKVKDIMVPLSSFSSIREDRTVADVLEVVLQSFATAVTTSTVQETLHRSILIMDRDEDVVGVITFTDLLRGLEPTYVRLLNESPVVADSRYLQSPSFSGMFTIMARDLASTQVREIMSEAPPVIGADANLMEAVSTLLNKGLRRLLVTEGDNIVGVIREQDLVLEMASIMRKGRDLHG